MHGEVLALSRAPSAQLDEALSYGRHVVLAGADALGGLAAALDDNFIAAVSLIVNSDRRVVVTGMGKSGHVGRKLAATLSATSTPAIFVHPAEAAHGDLGMLMPGDILLALSNSGRTPELSAIVNYALQLKCPLIAITSQADSPLMRQATVPLLLPSTREACPANIAPTTSTMLMMGLGDALAIAAMRVRGYTPAGLRTLHPGGQIGARTRPVSSFMHMGDSMPIVEASEPMREVIVTMTSKSFGVAGVVEDGKLVGVITDGDLRRHVDQLMDGVAAEVMTRSPVTVDGSTSAEEALALMNDHRITCLFVTGKYNGSRPVGIVHIHDFLRLGLA